MRTTTNTTAPVTNTPAGDHSIKKVKIMNNYNTNEECFVQRLIIIHFGLIPAASSGGLDEAASNDELCEQILYYNEYEKAFPLGTRCTYNFDEAIKFSGLCSAFYSIQSTIDCQLLSTENREVLPTKASLTKEVYLSTCTLVFIPLETTEVDGIVAIAQLPRRPKRKTKLESSKTSSKKLGTIDHLTCEDFVHKLTKGHEVFNHVNGGIHRRLCDQDNLIESLSKSRENDSNCHSSYVGMNEVYSILKQIRKLKMQCQDYATETDATRSIDNLKTLERKLKDLTDYLPIHALRLDLRNFYDSFLRHIAISEC